MTGDRRRPVSAIFQELLGRFSGAVSYTGSSVALVPRFLRLPSSDTLCRPIRGVLVIVAAATVVGCGITPGQPVLTQLLEARRLAADLHVQFSKAADAANRAVMSDTDVASAAAADEARRARQLVEQDVEALRSVLHSLRYGPELEALSNFTSRYENTAP